MRKRLRELEAQLGTVSSAVELSVTNIHATHPKKREQLSDEDNQAKSISPQYSTSTERPFRPKRLRRTTSDQTGIYIDNDNPTRAPLPHSSDPLEVFCNPTEIDLSPQAISIFDSTTPWDFPNPVDGVKNHDMSIAWPMVPSRQASPVVENPENLCSRPPEEDECRDRRARVLGSPNDEIQIDVHDDLVEIPAHLVRGETTLHLAARNGHQNIIAMLLDRGGDIEDTDTQGQSALHTAAECGHHSVVQLLVDRGATVHLPDAGGRTPLHLAASHGDMKIVECLLQHMMEKEVSDAWGRTPLHVAIEHGHEEIVLLLLDNGANPKARVSP